MHVVCTVDDCEAPHMARGWCTMHYHRWYTHGDHLAVTTLRTNTPTYRTVHARLVAARGKASSYACVECGGPASDWAFDEPTGYSTDLARYRPMCRSCHFRGDRAA